MNDNNFGILKRYGENYTDKEYITNPAIGRDEQIKELLLILLTPEKSAVLIGKPGVGKTAIVEGLAYRIQKGLVPDMLKGYKIINIKTASLLGTMPTGESKVQLMIDELKEEEKIILFIDEIHMLMGATEESSVDFANIFKEGLGRGSIKVVGATTTDEYERYILRDKAFTRRFQKVLVPEPNRKEAIQIMLGTLPKIEKTTGVKMKYTDFIKQQIMAFLVDITSEYKRVFEVGARYPDICLTLLKQAFSYAMFDNLKEVNILHFQKAIEDSKNIYPDVIKKEIPNFLEKFKDIIEDEKRNSAAIDENRYNNDELLLKSNNINIQEEILNEVPIEFDYKAFNVEEYIKNNNIKISSPYENAVINENKDIEEKEENLNPFAEEIKQSSNNVNIESFLNPEKVSINEVTKENNLPEDIATLINPREVSIVEQPDKTILAESKGFDLTLDDEEDDDFFFE